MFVSKAVYSHGNICKVYMQKGQWDVIFLKTDTPLEYHHNIFAYILESHPSLEMDDQHENMQMRMQGFS